MKYAELQRKSSERLNQNFWNWFGRSKVRNGAGKPLIVYHGTNAHVDFDSFNDFSHFGSIDAAHDLLDYFKNEFDNHRIIPVFLKIENPLELNDDWGPYESLLMQEISKQLMIEGHHDIGAAIEKEIQGPLNGDGQVEPLDGEPFWPEYDTKKIKALVRKAGYDGFFYYNMMEGTPDEPSWIPLESSQVKSVFNKGFWSDTPNINENIHQETDLKDVAEWLDTTPDNLEIEIVYEPISKFEKGIKEMYDSYDEFPEDARRTKKIMKKIRNGAELLPIYVEKDDPHNFIMEGRHRSVAFYLLGIKKIPVAYVSRKLNETILNEGRDAPLYHGTSMFHLAHILYYDELEKGVHWGRENEPDGVRLTRNPEVAANFTENPEFFMGGFLELSQTKLAQRYKIRPYKDVDANGEAWADEAEEVVIANSVKPLSRYLTAIYVPQKNIDEALEAGPEEFQMLIDSYGSSMTAQQIYGMISQIEKHPLRK